MSHNRGRPMESWELSKDTASWWEIVTYACWSDRKKLLDILQTTVIVISCIAFCVGVGIGSRWIYTGHSPGNMNTEDYLISILIMIFFGIPLLLVVFVIWSCIVESIKWCREYYARKKEELRATKAKRDIELMA